MLINTKPAMNFYLVWRNADSRMIPQHAIARIHQVINQDVRDNFDFRYMTDAQHNALSPTLPRYSFPRRDLC